MILNSYNNQSYRSLFFKACILRELTMQIIELRREKYRGKCHSPAKYIDI